jgi:hypothetical protein
VGRWLPLFGSGIRRAGKHFHGAREASARSFPSESGSVRGAVSVMMTLFPIQVDIPFDNRSRLSLKKMSGKLMPLCK